MPSPTIPLAYPGFLLETIPPERAPPLALAVRAYLVEDVLSSHLADLLRWNAAFKQFEFTGSEHSFYLIG
jgi:hypothetical protein